MSRYELLLFLHVTAVIVWLGTGTALTLIAIYAERNDRELLQRLGPIGRGLAPRVFGPSALGALVFGILLVLDGSWTFEPLWIKLGFGAFALSFLLNAAVRAPLVRRQARGEIDPLRVGRLLGRLARVELTVLYLAVADMIAKPEGGDVGTLAAGGAILALAVAFAAAGALRPAPRGVAS
jgi:putative copper export protein